MSRLRSLWGLWVAAVSTVVVMGAGLVVSLFTGGTAPAIHRFYTAFGRCTLWGFRSRVAVAGLEHLEVGQRYVVVPNHQSLLDVPALLVALREHPVRFIAKQELALIPVFGQALRRSGTIFVRRNDAQRDVGRMDAVQARLLRDVSVLFFAEGTRSDDGELQPFKKGAAAFAIKSGLPLVPIGIAGSREILPRGFRTNPGGTIGLSVGRPIPTEGRRLEDRADLTDEVRSAVEKEIERAHQLTGR